MKGFTSPEGILMLTIAVLLDLASIICAFLIAAFGIGAILNYVVEGLAFFIMGLWLWIRHSSLGSEPDMNTAKEKDEHPKDDTEVKQEETNKEIEGGNIGSTNKENEKKLPTTKKQIKGGGVSKNLKSSTKNIPTSISAVKKSLKTFVWNFIFETIPFLGTVWPVNTIIVYKEMKD